MTIDIAEDPSIQGSAPQISPSDPCLISARSMAQRRWIFATLIGGTILGMLVLMAITLSPSGFGPFEAALLALFAITLPWTVIGFWNAAIGLALMLGGNPLARVMPQLPALDPAAPIVLRTAILSCIRNEDVPRVFRNLGHMLDGLVAAGMADKFHAYILSDTYDPEIAAEEERAFAAFEAKWRGIVPVTYRRRETNPGFKAGNIRDFCDRWGADHDAMLVLDADSFMAAHAILRLVRLMQQDAKLGIVQSLVVGMPSPSVFARVFQFGMRLGMRSYTLGGAWWQGDCGPYWGHNALIRVAPFIQHCDMPMLPGSGPLSGWILSHDQVEAVLMRRAGYTVRVVPDEGGSWEENPPTLLEFIRRDLRWCQGNMQYWRLLGLPGLKRVSRMQLVLAIIMFIGSPAWLGFMILGAVRSEVAEPGRQMFDADAGVLAFALIMGMIFAPKIASIVQVAVSWRRMRGFGGPFGLVVSVVLEFVFSSLLSPIMAVAQTVFLGGLALGYRIGWTAQMRDGHSVSLRDALSRLWAPTLAGLAASAWLLTKSTGAFLAALPVLAGPLLAVPFAIATSWGWVGRAAIRLGIGRIPEESAPPPELQALAKVGEDADAKDLVMGLAGGLAGR